MLPTLRNVASAVLATAVFASGCASPSGDSRSADQAETRRTTTATSTNSSTATSTPSDTGLPLDQIDRDRPGNSANSTQPTMRQLKREGGICSVEGSRADCSKVPSAYRADAETLWQRTVAFFPAAVLSKMTDFVLLPRGQGGGVADSPNGSYLFSLAFPKTGDVDHIIIHELGHGFDVTTQRGFAKRWRQRFWTKAQTRAANAFMSRANPELDQNPVFTAAPDSFVHPYGATSASEDFAETFRWFVLGVKPTGTSIKEQKIQMLWTVPELVAARAHIQQARSATPGPITPDAHAAR